MSQGKIVKVAGPLIVAENMRDANMSDVVRVGKQKLIGEIIEMREDRASIQVYEETAGIGPGDDVETTGAPMSVELAPGVLTSIFDGIQRPLTKIREIAGSNITRGVEVTSLDHEKKWDFNATAKVGDKVVMGDILGTVQETAVVLHKIMVPKGAEGEIVEITSGSFNITETIAKIKDKDGVVHDVCMLQKWPVRVQRPYTQKLSPDFPMITGQRVIDTLFPIAKGGTAAVPGPFGSGKTVVQHQLAKWSDVDIVVYIGCGERGNEMTDVLNEFPELKDPKSGESLMYRTVLIANTSDMPVAAREASIYTGITIAEYYRDMGYSVAIICAGSDGREGSLTAIGAVSPAGGDNSDPVVQATQRIVKVFWGLDSSLAYKRHFPAINWLTSYSLYMDQIGEWMDKNIAEEWSSLHHDAMLLLQQEAELEEIVKLVGYDSLSAPDRLTLESARSVREDYLQQNAFDDTDTYTSNKKQYMMLKMIMAFSKECRSALSNGVKVEKLFALPVSEKIARAKYVPEDQFEAYFKDTLAEIETSVANVVSEEVSA